MKYITFAIPSYNSQNYMRRIIDNLVKVGEDIEVIIVNDGSTDNTGKIADEYQNKYPTIVKAIHKENGGHGSGVNTGIQNATGVFYKVVDSDDWVETEDVLIMLDLIKKHMQEGLDIDLYITNYVYEHTSDNTKFVMHYRKCLPVDKAFSWQEMRHVSLNTVFLMHSLMYRLDRLKASKMELPSHTFYVDDVYAYIPLPFMEKVFYHDLDFYHYFIGRDDQSINYDIMCHRYEQQMRVFKMMYTAYNYEELKKLPKPLFKYMFHFLMIIGSITIMTILGTKEDKPIRKQTYKEYWSELKKIDPKLYRKFRRSLGGFLGFGIPTYNLKSYISKKLYGSYQKRLKLG